MSFETDIRPLFREEDAEAMSWAFDLASYADVREHAEDIYDRLADGSMPLAPLQAMPTTLLAAAKLRHASSSVVPVFTNTGTPCVLACRAFRAPEAGQHHLKRRP